MERKKFDRLFRESILTHEEFERVMQESKASGIYPEELLIKKGIPKHEVLFSLSEYYSCPFVEFSEKIMASYLLTKRLDIEKHRRALWFPLSVVKDRAEVIAYKPGDPAVAADVKKTLGVKEIDFIIALPSDLSRIIDNNFDVNPDAPFSAGRTPLAKVRTFLAIRRSMYACYRTTLAKGRTGLAFIRTGISFIAISLLLLRVFGIGYLTIFESALLIAGIIMTIDGIIWYLPARKSGRKSLHFSLTEAAWGSTVLEVPDNGDNPSFRRSGYIKGADRLRSEWNNLSPVMRRRFLASDRTDMAEERTVLAYFRTMMAKSRTGLAFTRTGVAFIGIGIALLRQFHAGPWTTLDVALIITGCIMAMEGFYWYFPGRGAGREGLELVRRKESKPNIWDHVFPPVHRHPGPESSHTRNLPVKSSHSPGIWATTGLALERTLLADRRNVMARVRTFMARSRTGLAFIRTGMRISAVGLGLLIYFGTANTAWTVFNVILIVTGLLFIADGLYWHIPAEKIRRQFPYCFGDMEIIIPDYGKPTRYWEKVVF